MQILYISNMRSFLEFFAGGGMARLGLEPDWRCVFANDISEKKANAYRMNFPDAAEILRVGDICNVPVEDLPQHADLIWGSFPCQDLSLAGYGLGLSGARSGLVWTLLDRVEELARVGSAPALLVFENVNGLLNARGGDDLREILGRTQSLGYTVGVLAIDAACFLPQSRQRVFIVAARPEACPALNDMAETWPQKFSPWISPRLRAVWEGSSVSLRSRWVWWRVPQAPRLASTLADVLEPESTIWDSPDYTSNLVELMSEVNQRKLNAAKRLPCEVVGAAYRRTRIENGRRVQRIEVRFDGMSGCLRTASGGSSRQRLLFVDGERVRSRLLSAREAARLMGIPDWYWLPPSFNEGYELAGDGVAVPVVRWLSHSLLLPLMAPNSPRRAEQEAAYVLYA